MKPYEKLKTYQQSKIIYDFTVEFTNRYIKSYRTREQMDQAARSGKQNIAEGSDVSQTSKKSEIKLLGVAHGSLMELTEDYEDYLRQHNLEIWSKEHPQAQTVRNLVYQFPYPSYDSYKSYLTSDEQAANAMLCLTNQTTYLLKRQIASRKEQFLEKGGFSESLYKDRITVREKQLQQLDNDKFILRNR